MAFNNAGTVQQVVPTAADVVAAVEHYMEGYGLTIHDGRRYSQKHALSRGSFWCGNVVLANAIFVDYYCTQDEPSINEPGCTYQKCIHVQVSVDVCPGVQYNVTFQMARGAMTTDNFRTMAGHIAQLANPFFFRHIMPGLTHEQRAAAITAAKLPSNWATEL